MSEVTDLVIRVDDLGWSTETEKDRYPIKAPDAGLRLARAFHEAMGGVPYLGAVIPSCVDDEGLAWLRTNPAGLTVALHGWDHGRNRPSERDEFSGLPPGTVRELIAMGHRKLGNTRHLVPPYNAIPPALPEAAYLEGIRYIWGADYPKWPTPAPPYSVGRMWVVPSFAPFYGAAGFKQAKDSPVVLDMLRAKMSQKTDLIAVITLHITWEAARDPEFMGVRELVRLARPFVVTPDAYVERYCR